MRNKEEARRSCNYDAQNRAALADDIVVDFGAACNLLPLAFGLPMALMLAMGVMLGWI